MDYELYTNPMTKERHIKVVISDSDVMRIGPYTQVERALLNECDKSTKASDKLVAFALVARKIEALGDD